MLERRIGARLVVATAVATAFAAAAFATPAGAFVYWANQNGETVSRANLNGTAVDLDFIPSGNACGVAVNDTHIFWGNRADDAIARANLDGSGADLDFIPGADGPCGVAVNDTHVYWANTSNGGAGTVGRAVLNGGSPDHDILDVDTEAPCGVAVDEQHLYWTDLFGSDVGRADLDGANADDQFIASEGGTCGVTTNDTHIFWTTLVGTVGRADLDDGDPADDSFIDNIGEDIRGVAVNATHIYWAENSDGRIGRANLNGTAPNPNLIVGLDVPSGVALDNGSVPVPPTPPPPGGDTTAPDTTITDGPKKKVKAKRKRKKVSFGFTATEAGAVFECSLDGEAYAACTSPHTEKVKKGKHSFEVRAKDAAGNVDQTPAEDAFQVKKKKKKKK
jgi:hypothetical protein